MIQGASMEQGATAIIAACAGGGLLRPVTPASLPALE